MNRMAVILTILLMIFAVSAFADDMTSSIDIGEAVEIVKDGIASTQTEEGIVGWLLKSQTAVWALLMFALSGIMSLYCNFTNKPTPEWIGDSRIKQVYGILYGIFELVANNFWKAKQK